MNDRMIEYMSRTLQSYDGPFEFRISEAMALQKFTGCAVYPLDVADVLLNGAVKFFQDKNVKKGMQTNNKFQDGNKDFKICQSFDKCR